MFVLLLFLERNGVEREVDDRITRREMLLSL